MARSRDISKVLSSNSTLATDAEVSASYLTTASANALYAPVAAGGLVQITPTSVTATGGSGSISATGAVSFTSASAISLNGCFTSSYRNYQIVTNITAGTGSSSIRLRASGSDATASNYVYTSLYQNTSGTVLNNASSASATSWGGSGMFDTSPDGVNNIFIYNPQLASQTTMNFLCVVGDSGLQVVGGGKHTLSTAYDSLTLFQSGNISGVIRVYGYKN